MRICVYISKSKLAFSVSLGGRDKRGREGAVDLIKLLWGQNLVVFKGP